MEILLLLLSSSYDLQESHTAVDTEADAFLKEKDILVISFINLATAILHSVPIYPVVLNINKLLFYV